MYNKRRFGLIQLIQSIALFCIFFAFLFKLAIFVAVVLGCIWLGMQVFGS